MSAALVLPFPASDASDDNLTVRCLVALYLEHEGPLLAPVVLRQRKQHLDRFVAKFGGHAIEALFPSDLKSWVRNEKSWKADDTKRNVIRGIKRVFAWALDDARIERNPFRRVDWPAGKPRRSMTDREYQLLFRNASDHRFRRVLLFLRETGARPQDIERLRWQHVHFERCLCVLPEHKTEHATHEPRVLYLTPISLALLRWLYRQPKRNDIVFVNQRRKPWQGACLCQRMIRLRDRCGIETSCKLYGLRHRYGNQSQRAGNDIRTTADLMGHRSVRTTERHYLHPEERTQSLLKAADRACRAK